MFHSTRARLRGLVLAVLLSSPPALGAEEILARFPGKGGVLTFARQAQGLSAAWCRGRCDFERGASVPVPAELLPLLSASAFSRVALEQQRVVVHLRMTLQDRTWEALVTPPLAPGDAPGVPFSEWTGFTVDDEGERTAKVVEVNPVGKAESRVVTGTLRDDVTLCGRRALLDPKVLLPDDLRLHRVKFMRLSEEERATATKLVPVPDEASTGTSITRARVASSAQGSPAALSDGDLDTAWAEARSGNGRGEFVVFRAPELLPVRSFYWASADEAPAPDAFWIATDRHLYRVETNAGATGSAQRQRVDLPVPETTSCVALVLDEAQSGEGNVDVSLAEFGARTDIDEAGIGVLVNALDDPSGDPVPAIRTLAALGRAAVEVLAARYPELSPAGKARAVMVYDALPCEETARAYARAAALEGSDGHVAERLLLCGPTGEAAVLAELRKATAPGVAVLASVLARMNPEKAAKRLVPLLAKSNRARRRALREALGKVAGSDAARPRLTEWLLDEELPRVAAIDLLRALGEHVVEYREPASLRIRALLAAGPVFRDRYLLLEPISRLAPGDAQLGEVLLAMLTQDEMNPVRARAARLMPATPAFVPALVQAADDPEVRVREAAILNLTEDAVESGRTVLLRRLKEDPWPFVRAASIKGLLVLAPSPAVDQALAESAERDESANVRRPAIFALGARDARAHVEVVRRRLDDDDEDPFVRAAAAATLGTLCDHGSVDVLTKHARAITRLSDDEASQVIGRSSVHALGRLAPADLKSRLSMFQGDQVPPWSRELAESAATYDDTCPR